MHDAVYHQFARTLETHWWSDHRRKLFAGWLAELGISPDGSRSVLEIGCGAGTEHGFLGQYGPVTGVELSETGLGYCRQRPYAELIAADLNTVELPRERFDLAVDFHVLYHAWVKEPGDVLSRVRDSLRPGGRLLVTEPAHEVLRRGHDEVVMAARRWSLRELSQLVSGSGFEIERSSGFLTLLTPAVLVSALVDRLRPLAHDVAGDIGELRPPGPFVDGALRAVMAIERAAIRVSSLPFGTSWALIARRR